MNCKYGRKSDPDKGGLRNIDIATALQEALEKRPELEAARLPQQSVAEISN
jgi:hypothetical protein